MTETTDRTLGRLLVVDDEPGMRSAIRRALRDFVVNVPSVEVEIGFQIDEAATGEEAIDRIGDLQPDIVLLDHKLSGMSGLDLLGWIDDHNLDLVAVMTTAYASLDTAVKATKRGAYDFLPKPFTPVELKASIRKAAKHLLVQRHARKLAEERRQVRFEFISVLAHELKSPLGAVEGFLQIVQDNVAEDDPEMQDRLIGRSIARVREMRKLIYDLLDLTRIESGNRERELEDTDLLATLREAMENAGVEAAQREIAIDLEAPESLPVRADASELQIIFNNLVSNAVKYNRDGGKVDIRVHDDGDTVRIEVADTGIGMTEEEAAKLFRDFFRIKNKDTRGIPGSGLGLSTVKKLAELYGGSVRVQSAKGVGSTFTVELDKFPEVAEASPSPAAEASRP
jgi:signal transduction histidine kinase